MTKSTTSKTSSPPKVMSRVSEKTVPTEVPKLLGPNDPAPVSEGPPIGGTARMLIALGFIAFLALPLLATIAGIRPAAIDNREPVAAPDVGVDTLLADATYDEGTRYLIDRFALRSLAVRANAKVNQEVWKADTDRVKRGTAGWLFLDDSLQRLCREPLSASAAIDVVGEVGTAVVGSGRQLAATVAPAKTAIYPEFLSGRSVNDGQCVAEERDALRQRRSELGADWFVDLYEPLDAAKAASATPIYHDRDTHWTEEGMLVMFEELLGRFEPNVWNPDEAQRVGTEPLTLDLTKVLGLPVTAEVPDVEIVRPGVTTTKLEPVAVERAEDIERYRSTSSEAPLLGGHTLVVHDSFTVLAYDEFATYFESVDYVHWNALAADVDLVELIVGADRVIFEMAEREVSWRANEVLLAERIASRVAALG